MPSFLVTYDVERTNPDPHPVIKSEAYSFGYYSIMHDYQNVIKKLPNTTLNGNFTDFSTAQTKFYDLISRARAKNGGVLNLEKYIIVEIASHLFCSNEAV